MNRRLVVLLQIALLLLMCVPAIAAANGISMELNKSVASVGEIITATGKTAPNAWVPIKVIDEAQNIVLFDAKKADDSGDYSIEFKVPAGASGTLTIIVGEGSNVIFKDLTVGTEAPTDTIAPTWPSGSTLNASDVTRTGLTLKWGAAADNVKVTGYRIYKNGIIIDTVSVSIRTYNVTGLSSGTRYTFKVEAGDAVGNWSTTGPSTTVTTIKASSGSGGGSGSSSSGGGTSTIQPETKVSEPITGTTQEVNAIKLTIGQLVASINGTPYTLDVKPYIDTKAGRTLVPIRFISEALGAGVEWIPDARQVKITDSGRILILTIGNRNVLFDNTQLAIDCAPEIVSERTFLPLRFVSENLGAQVIYEDQTKEITISR